MSPEARVISGHYIQFQEQNLIMKQSILMSAFVLLSTLTFRQGIIKISAQDEKFE